MSDTANAPIDLANNSELIADLARFSEGVLTEQQIRRKWRHLDNSVWDAPDDALVDAVEAERVRRIRTGTSPREKAQLLHTKSPDILSEIMTSDVSPRHKIESARALGQIATPVSTPAPVANAERFVIQINLGNDEVLRYSKPIAAGPEPDAIDHAPQELLPIIATTKQGTDGDGGQSI
jgi:hypothetical protein